MAVIINFHEIYLKLASCDGVMKTTCILATLQHCNPPIPLNEDMRFTEDKNSESMKDIVHTFVAFTMTGNMTSLAS